MFLRLCICAIFLTISSASLANGVFLDRKQDAYQLSKAEQQQIRNEFVRKFGPMSNTTNQFNTANNPWQNKKKHTSRPGVNWGVCRDYALHMRNQCYRAANPAYQCERFYEARVKLCNEQFDD